MKVAVVIPLYNKVDYIQRALDSVLRQTYSDFEVIVVDDGSTDKGAEVARRCQDSRVRLLIQQNAGECAARNRGVAETQAEWIAFLDADDEWLPEFLERVTSLAQSNDSLVAVFSNRKDAIRGKARLQQSIGPGGIVDDHFRFCLENRRSGMSSSTVLVRRSVFLSAGGFPAGVPHFGDLDTWGRLAWMGNIGYVPDVLAVYHMETPNSATKQAHQNPPYPEYVRTYKRWREDGRIPVRLLDSSERYAYLLILVYASFLADAGNRIGARDVLRREYPLTAWPRYGFVRTYLRFLLFPRLVDFLRSWHILA